MDQSLHGDVPPMCKDNCSEDIWIADSCLNFDFGSEASNKCFEANHKTKSGAACLCSHSQFHMECMSAHLDSEEVLLDLKCACLSSQLAQGSRSLLAKVIGRVIDKVSAECKNPGTSDVHLSIPNAKELIRSCHMEGRHAMCPNSPIPPVQESEEHSCVSPIDVTKDISGHSLPFDQMSHPQCLSGDFPLVA